MRSFVTGLVRRGAGLPTPVMIRPAGFRKMSLSPEAGEATSDATAAEPTTNREHITATGDATPGYPRPDAPIEQPAVVVRPQHPWSPATMPQQSSVEEVADVSIMPAPTLAPQSIPSRQDSAEVRPPSRNAEATAELSPAPTIAPALPAPLLRD